MEIYYEAVAGAIVNLKKEGKEPSKIVLGKWVYDSFKTYQMKITEGKGGEDIWFGLPIEVPEDVAPDHFSIF